MIELFALADFVRRARTLARFDDFSRSPLQLLRVEWRSNWAECDWLMRPPDPWDCDLPERLVRERETLQALRDALGLRSLFFEAFPGLDRAEFRMFRAGEDQQSELMITGSLQRADEVLTRVASVAMRAKLCGFRFSLSEGVLESMAQVSISCT